MPDSMDWVKANVRSCDDCGRETDAGEWPEWPNGVCEDCDPTILEYYAECNFCGEYCHKDYMKKIEDLLDHSSKKSVVYRCVMCEEDN